MSVTCVNHLISDADLPLGTGPLFNFERISDDHHTPSSLSVETSLSHSCLRNVTSSPSPALRLINSNGHSQKMIGVEVCGCSNHLYGTVCDDMNNGGSILCLNSSFSRCSTSLPPSSTHPTYILQHRTGAEQLLLLPPKDSSSVSFSHCTFHTVTSNSDGAAIALTNGLSPVSVTVCSFVDCKTTLSYGSGSAVHISNTWPYNQSVSVMSSVFTGCYAPNQGGIICLSYIRTATLADCSFVGTELHSKFGDVLYIDTLKEVMQFSHCLVRDLDAPTFGSAITLFQVPTSVITFSSFISCHARAFDTTMGAKNVDVLNCMFVECNDLNSGGLYVRECSDRVTVQDSLFDRCNASNCGGLYINSTPSVKLDNLKFRACTSDKASDVYIRLSKTEVIQGNMITNCVSTSDTNNILFYNGSYEFDNTLIHHVASIDVPAIALSASLDGDEVGWSLSVTANASVDGRMLVVLDHNSASVYEKPNLDSPPPIARLFVFDFSSSQTVSQSVSLNEWNLLQYEANYSMAMASLAGTDITLASSSIETPNPARIVEVITDWSSSQPEQLSFQLKGRTLSSGNYNVKVKGVSDLSIDVSFTGQPTNQSESRNMHSTTATLLLVGEGSKLTFDRKYEIESVEKADGTSLILDPPHLFFTTPNPTRLTSVSDAVFTDPLDKSTVFVTLSGGNFPTGSYSLNVSLIGEQPSTEITINVTFLLSDSGKAKSAVVFKRDGSQVDLLFGERYNIRSLSNASESIWIPSPLSFSVPECPGIVERVSSCSLDDAKSSVLVTFEGCCFVTGSTHVVVSDGSNEAQSKGDLSVINSTHFSVSFTAGWTQSWLHVAYGETYSVKSVSLSSTSFLVRSSIFVTIPKPPCVTSISCNFDTNLTHFVVTLSGESLPPAATYTALLSPSASFEVTFSENVGKSDPIEGNATNGLLFGTEYTLSSLSHGDNQILLNKTTFSTPLGPALSDVVCSLDAVDSSFVVLALSGLRMPSSSDYKLIVAEKGGPAQVTLNVSFSSSSVGSGSVEVFEKENTLEYGQSYSVVSLSLDSLLISLPSQSITFDVPNPPRLTAVDEPIVFLPSDHSKISIVLMGTEIPVGSYSLNVSLVGDRPSDEIRLTTVFSSKESGTATAVVFYANNGKVDLLFDKKYSIKSLWNVDGSIWIPSPLSFTVPKCPGIVESFLSASLNDAKTIVTLTFRGTDFTPGPTHVVLSDGSDEVKSNGDLTVIDYTHFTVTFTAGWTQSSSTVAYGRTYSLKSVSSSSTSFLVRSSILVNIPKPPCVTGISCNFDTNLTHFVVTLTGEDLPKTGTYTARLMSPSVSFEVTFSDNSGMSDPIEGNLMNGLLFGTEYKLSSLSHGDDVILLNKTTFSTPSPPFVNAASFHFVNEIKTSCKLVLGGTNLALEGEFKVTLEPPLSIIVSFSSATHGESDELRIGWPGELEYGQNYTIQSITHSISETLAVVVDSDVSFTTEPEPASILLFVDSSGSSSLLCGDLTRPCSSMDIGLSIVSGIGLTRADVKIVEKGTQNTVHSMSLGSVLSISTSSPISATLEIGSSASIGSQSGLFVVLSGRLEFHDISVSVLPTDPSFVLVSGDHSTLVLKNTSFFGRSSGSLSKRGDTNTIPSLLTSESSDESEFVCDWLTGLIKLSNCTTTITSTQLHDLGQGAINMKSGMVDIETSTFHNNTHRHSSFPSARQNIHCSDGGVVKVGSLFGGDGSSDMHPHLWIAADECSLSGDDVQPSHPFFVPTLSTTSTSTLDKRKKEFAVTILGSTLIPCGLWLEVFEVGKVANAEISKKIELTENSTLSFTETKITFSLPQTTLASLDSSLEWRGRLVFGEELRTAESFLIQSDSSSRMAESVKDNMKWWIPLVVVLSCLLLALILVVILCRRRRSKSEEAKTNLANEMDQHEMEVEKMEEDVVPRSDNLVISSDQYTQATSQQVSICKEQAVKPTGEPLNAIPIQNRVEALSCGGEMKTVVVNKMDTLYERLHTSKMVFDRRHVEQMIVRGMMQLMEKRHEETGLRLSSHWVLFDSQGEVCISHAYQSRVWSPHLLDSTSHYKQS